MRGVQLAAERRAWRRGPPRPPAGGGGRARADGCRGPLPAPCVQRGVRIDGGVLAVGRRQHHQAVHVLEAPAAFHEFDGQPVEQFGVRRRLAHARRSRWAWRRCPAPKWCCQRRLTITRAVSGLSFRVSQSARAERRPVLSRAAAAAFGVAAAEERRESRASLPPSACASRRSGGGTSAAPRGPTSLTLIAVGGAPAGAARPRPASVPVPGSASSGPPAASPATSFAGAVHLLLRHQRDLPAGTACASPAASAPPRWISARNFVRAFFRASARLPATSASISSRMSFVASSQAASFAS